MDVLKKMSGVIFVKQIQKISRNQENFNKIVLDKNEERNLEERKSNTKYLSRLGSVITIESFANIRLCG